jgi:hemin uptake protein HemP
MRIINIQITPSRVAIAMTRPTDIPTAPHGMPRSIPSPNATVSAVGIDSRDLMRGSREVQIRHAGQVYRLRHTRNDKLILVK